MHELMALVIVSLAAGPETAKTTSRFETMTSQIRFFPTGEFLNGRADMLQYEHPHVSKAWIKDWHNVNAELTSRKDPTADVIALLKNNDPKVRTLALAALFERQDPKMLPHIAALMSDKAKTFEKIQSWGGNPPPKPILEKQTVGDVANAFVGIWMGSVVKEGTSFETYWNTRKDRKFCASWFLLRIQRAANFSSHVEKERAPLIRAIRKEIDALPAVDRDWTLLWLASHRSFNSDQPANNLVSPEERIAAAKRLGPVRLMELIQDKKISDDPDFSPTTSGTGREGLIYWVVHNAGKLLRPEDAPALLAEEYLPPSGFIRAGFVIGAAELQPKNAQNWLRAALKSRTENYHPIIYYRAELAAALWRMVGESEIDFLADWFYGERVNSNDHPGQTTVFLREIKGVRTPADRKLVARLIDDKRLDRLDYQSTRGLIETANGWTKIPVVSQSDLRPFWEYGRSSPESERDEAVLAGWRTKLKKSQAEWNK